MKIGMVFLASVVDALVVIQTVQCAEHFVTQIANSIVQWL